MSAQHTFALTASAPTRPALERVIDDALRRLELGGLHSFVHTDEGATVRVVVCADAAQEAKRA